MNIKYDKLMLNISSEECRDIFYSLRSAVEHAIDTHWQYHPDSYNKMESIKLSLLRTLAPYAGWDAQETIKTLQQRLDELVKKGK